MKRFSFSTLAFIMFAVLLITPAFADIASGAVYIGIGIPLLAIAIFIILAALLIKTMRKRTK